MLGVDPEAEAANISPIPSEKRLDRRQCMLRSLAACIATLLFRYAHPSIIPSNKA